MKNLQEFVIKLRRYKKDEVVRLGTSLLWSIARNRKHQNNKIIHLLNSYSTNLITLALATANNHRNKTLRVVDFYNLCHEYLNINDPLNNPTIKENECCKIIACLKDSSSKRPIPSEYLNLEVMKNIYSIFFISRLSRQQHATMFVNEKELLVTYDILYRLNTNLNGVLNNHFKNTYEVDFLHLIRIFLILFAMANDENGIIRVKNITIEENLKNSFNLDVDQCELIASKIAYDEFSLRKKWYEGEVLAHNELYQKYYPTPLYKNPIIAINSIRNIDYLIPSPLLFIKGTNDSIFYDLCSKKVISSNDLGNAIENHIYDCLKKIFGDRISKISTTSNSRTADFYLDLQDCNFIIECKAAMGGHNELSTMAPDSIPRIWEALYSACEQCANTIKNYSTKAKPLIPIILIATPITAETLAFNVYAHHSTLFKNMGLDYVEFFSWDVLQHHLSRTSIKKFTEEMLNRKHMKLIENVLSCDFQKDTPAHNYEYLKDAEYDIYGKNFD